MECIKIQYPIQHWAGLLTQPIPQLSDRLTDSYGICRLATPGGCWGRKFQQAVLVGTTAAREFALVLESNKILDVLLDVPHGMFFVLSGNTDGDI